MSVRRPLVSLALLAVSACSSAPPPVSTPRLAYKEASIPPEPQPKDSVSREAVDTVIAGGLGKFLQNVDVEAQVDDGKFVGWRVVELVGDMWKGVDLQVGDVVTRINGYVIEREHQADKAFRSLAVASEIRVTLLRKGEKREIRFSIV